MKVVFGACGSRKATVRVTIDAGSSVEYGGIWTPGIAHLMEHMIFQGGDDFDSVDLSRELASLGADHNAATWHEKVSFYVETPAENVSQATKLLATTLLNRTFNEESLEKEKLVVLEEERGSHDDIDTVIHEQLNAFLCTGPVAEPILGTQESIKSITLEEIQAFYDCYYRPSRMLMTITGSNTLDHKEITSFFGGDTGRFRRSKTGENKYLKRKRLVVPATIKQARIFVTYKAFPVGNKHSLPLHFMSKFFSNGMDTRLFEELRQKRGLCYGIGSFVALEKDLGWYVIQTRVAQENISKSIKLIGNEIDKLLSFGPTQEEIVRARNKYISDIYGFIETSYGLNTMLEAKTYNNLPPLEKSIDRIKKMTKKQIMRTCNKTLVKDTRRVFICTPQGDGW
jgi:predicted Zn-dependent peptidase